MKKIDFSYTGGFPLDENIMDILQTSSKQMFKAIIDYIQVPPTGNFILSGVELTGANVSAGWVYMDGDIIEFPAVTVASGLSTKFKKIITATDVAYEDTFLHPALIEVSVAVDAAGADLGTFTRINSIPIIPPNIVLDPADLTTTPPELTVLQRLSEVEKKLSVFTANGVVFPWRKKLADIPAGWQEVTALRG